MPTELAVFLISFAGMFVLAFAGFGGALVIVPLFIGVVGVRITTPLARLVGLLSTGISVTRYWRDLNWRNALQLMLAASIGIPVGFYVFDTVDQRQAELIIGGVVVIYTIYAWFTPTLPELYATGWAYLAGFIAGIMTGSFAIPGPPVILYGTARGWNPKEFKSTLQSFFMFTATFSGIGHLLRGDFTAEVLRLYLYAVPGVLLGTFLGIYLGERVNHETFRKIVLLLLLVLGIRLMM